jgi:hypothetical protein
MHGCRDSHDHGHALCGVGAIIERYQARTKLAIAAITKLEMAGS